MVGDQTVRGKRLGVITNAGFEAGAVSDHLYDLDLVEFSAQTKAELEAVLPEIAHAANPIDATPMAGTEEFIAAVEILIQAPEIDALVVSAVPATANLEILAPDLSGEHAENAYAMNSLPAELIRVFKSSDKPMVVAIDSGRLYDPSVILLERAGIPVYRKIDRASRAMSAAVGHYLKDVEVAI
jgi:acyl-CoA synthetase (NDP forming)